MFVKGSRVTALMVAFGALLVVGCHDEKKDAAPQPPAPPAPVVANVLSIAPGTADPSGGGGEVIVTVDHSDGALGASLGGVPLSSFRIVDGTHVAGVPGAHAAGNVAVTVRNAAGESSGGTTFEYWSPRQINGVDAVLDAREQVTLASGRVTQWTAGGASGATFAQADVGKRPAFVPDAFTGAPGIAFTGGEFLRLDTPRVMTPPTERTVFAVARWNSNRDASADAYNTPLTILADAASGYGSFGAGGGAIALIHYAGGPLLTRGAAGLNDGNPQLFGVAYDADTTVRFFVGHRQQGADRPLPAVIGLNQYDIIGAGSGFNDGFDGVLGALVIVAGQIGEADRVRLDHWAAQRYGVPLSAPPDRFIRRSVGEMPAGWFSRDGSQLVSLGSGRLLMIGGWNISDPFGSGDRLTNEVWKSDDGGDSWQLLLAHDPAPPVSGPGARFLPMHTAGVTTWQGHAVLIGSDPSQAPYSGDVWLESDNGSTWTRVSTTAPSAGRTLFMLGTLGDDIYLMGGQSAAESADSGIADVWRSRDGGLNWTQLAAPPWSPRGMVYRPTEHHGRLYVVGGGLYAYTGVPFNGVYAFDGEQWETVLPDGHLQWRAAYYVALASSGDRLWLINGVDNLEEFSRVMVSDDDGAHWTEFGGGAGGHPSHADAVLGMPGRVLRISGYLHERGILEFVLRP